MIRRPPRSPLFPSPTLSRPPVDRARERPPPPAFETSAVARLVLVEDEPAPPLRFVAALDDPRRRVVGRGAEPHRDRRLGPQISYPVRPFAAARQQVQRASLEREPDLDLVRKIGRAHV